MLFRSFAISKKLGLPDYIIDDAKTHLESEDETFEDVISRLEENRVTIEKERAEIESYKAEIARLKSGLEKKEERFDERKDKMIRKANEEAQQILREAKETADRENVDVRLYRVIYDAIEDIESAMKGMLEPIYEEKVIAHVEVRQTFKASGVGTIAGSYVLDGKVERGCRARITREEIGRASCRERV